MDTLLIVLLVGGGIIAVVGPIIWVAFVVYAAVKTNEIISNIPHTGASRPFNQAGELDALLGELAQELRSAGTARALGGHGGGMHLPAHKLLEIQNMMMQTQNRMQHLDNLSRQRYETRMADLSGMAASAGIDWTPGSY